VAMNRRGLNVPITADTSGLRKGVRESEQELDKLETASKKTGAALVGHIGNSGARAGVMFKQGITPIAGFAAAAGLAAGAALTKGISQSLDVGEANAKLKAQLGLSSKDAARIGKISGSLYASNFGDSLGEVNDAVRSVMTDIDGMGKASSRSLRGVTSDVISVAKTFDQDLGGVTRAVGQMMRTGLAKNAREALDVITVGFQSGADKSQDFLDTLNEYGTQFRKLGIDGQTATGLISQGLRAGARDSDIVADAIKEFSIRAVDGSTTTAAGFKQIGLSAKDMAEQIGKGGPAARKGLDTVLDRIRAIKDPVKQSQAAVALFGTQAEDLGQALYALDPSRAVKGLNDVGGAARRVTNTLGDTPKSKIQEFWRTLQSGGTGALSKVTPMLGDAAGAATKFVKQMRSGSGAGGEFAARIGGAVDKVKTAVSSWVDKNRADIDSVVSAFKLVGRFAKQVFQETMLPIIRRTAAAIGPIFDGLWHTIRGIVRLVSGLLSGNWSKAWDGAKEAVAGAWKAIKTSTVTQIENIWQIIKDFGPKLVKGILVGLRNMGKALAEGLLAGIKWAAANLPGMAASALKGLGSAIGHTITGAIGNLFGDGLGKKIGDGVGRISAAFPAFGGGLMGANPALSPIAGAGSRFGLHVSSGLRPGAITSSGNRSFHASGEALDEAGTPGGMAGFFRFMKNTMGPRLAELIYTGPGGGTGIKDGQPFTYTGQVAADHHDHVHVAVDLPGVGDGIGWGDGIGFRGLEDLWVRAKGPTKLAPLMAHIAQAESNGDPTARNPSGASGLWQILGQPFAGNVLDPLTNAKMAVWKYQHQGLGAWAASRYVWGKYVNSGETYSPTRGSAGSKPKKSVAQVESGPDGRYNPNTHSGRSGGGITDYDPASIYNKQQTRIVGGIRVPVTDTDFMPFTGKGIKGLPTDLIPPAVTDTQPDTYTHEDQILANIAKARVGQKIGTATKADELLYTTELRDTRRAAYEAALQTADPRDDVTTADALGEAVDALKALTDAEQEQIDQAKALTDALNQVQAELKRQTDFATSVKTTSNYQLTKALADVISGHIVGRGVAGRSFTPGSGVEYVY
jgi:hypothetical protein